MSRKVFPKAFVTGCDESQEWMLTWFMKNFRYHSHETKIIFADFGISDSMKRIVDASDIFCGRMEMIPKNPNHRTWFMKPEAMWFAPAEKMVWLDLDIEVKANVDDIFDCLQPDKLNMVEDTPWTKRAGETWHNSGVVGVIHKPLILKKWAQECGRGNKGGDQETLHAMLNPITRIGAIHTLPKPYNVLRLDVDVDNYDGKIKLMHWTGPKGKDKIRSMM